MKKLLFFTCIGIFAGMQSCKPKVDNTQAAVETTKDSIQLLAFEPSAAFDDAAITKMDYRDGQFKFLISGNYQLGQQTPDAPQKMCANSDKGQHIHLIVDNKPYEAKYEADFHYKIEDGTHYVLAFLSRSYHESIKNPKASVLIQAEVKDSSFKKLSPVDTPMLFYSRPKGTYVGNDTRKVMLDFYLANCRLGPMFKVKAEINNQEFIIDKWQPYYITGLPLGENKIKLSLLDSTGMLVNNPFNPIERTFTLQAEPGQK